VQLSGRSCQGWVISNSIDMGNVKFYDSKHGSGTLSMEFNLKNSTADYMGYEIMKEPPPPRLHASKGGE